MYNHLCVVRISTSKLCGKLKCLSSDYLKYRIYDKVKEEDKGSTPSTGPSFPLETVNKIDSTTTEPLHPHSRHVQCSLGTTIVFTVFSVLAIEQISLHLFVFTGITKLSLKI